MDCKFVVRIFSLFPDEIHMLQLNPFHSIVAFHIETSHLFCRANQATGFYMKCKTGLKWITDVPFYFSAAQHVAAVA